MRRARGKPEATVRADATEVGEKSDTSIGRETIGSRYARPQPGDRRFRFASRAPIVSARQWTSSMIETTRQKMEKEEEKEEEKKVVEEIEGERYDGNKKGKEKKKKKGESKSGTRERSTEVDGWDRGMRCFES